MSKKRKKEEEQEQIAATRRRWLQFGLMGGAGCAFGLWWEPSMFAPATEKLADLVFTYGGGIFAIMGLMNAITQFPPPAP